MAKITEELLKEIGTQMAKGAKASEVAKALNISVKTVYKYAKKAAKSVKGPKAPKEPKSFAVLFGSKITRKDIEQSASKLKAGEGVQKYAAEVNGGKYPIRPLVAGATSIPKDKAKFYTSEAAKRILTQLQFPVTAHARSKKASAEAKAA